MQFMLFIELGEIIMRLLTSQGVEKLQVLVLLSHSWIFVVCRFAFFHLLYNKLGFDYRAISD